MRKQPRTRRAKAHKAEKHHAEPAKHAAKGKLKPRKHEAPKHAAKAEKHGKSEKKGKK